jgi:hypothetical protein
LATPSSAPSVSAPTARPSPAPATASPAPNPTWSAISNVSTPAFHTAVLLRDGRVLVAGGLVHDLLDGRPSAAVDLFDPTTDSWTPALHLLEPRWGHTATRLTDGTVLVVGSYVNSADPLASAELFDPDTTSWRAAGGPHDGRGGHTATLLADGTVLIVGGDGRGGAPRLATVERYDPARGVWSPAAPMGTPRAGHTATLLADGRVLVVGGGGEVGLAEGPAYSATAELFDPRTGRWARTGPMVVARFGQTATLLPNGLVLVAGGSTGDGAAARSAELYDPVSGRWTRTSSMSVERTGHTATLLTDGTVLVAGGVGLGSDPDPNVSAEVYDPRTGRWTETVSPAQAPFSQTATRLADGRVLVLGYDNRRMRASAELYDPQG